MLTTLALLAALHRPAIPADTAVVDSSLVICPGSLGGDREEKRQLHVRA